MPSIFTRIIKGELPSYKIDEDEHCYAFLDINPNAHGHVLCVPKQEVDKLFDLDDDLYEHLMRFSKRIAKALRQAVSCERVGMAVIGLEVPHAHVHLIPISEMHQMTFQTKVKLSENEFAALAEKITAEL
ncbi:MAG: HIT family protein [Flavobacteriaceae bacterium]|jgi:histidine triad (HIT) family protein|nr:HIT family protein [Flavobacteriaceae bacterium]MBT7459392.1 HIT family protein [Flavobacteriaceae bacterium]